MPHFIFARGKSRNNAFLNFLLLFADISSCDLSLISLCDPEMFPSTNNQLSDSFSGSQLGVQQFSFHANYSELVQTLQVEDAVPQN